MDTGYRALRERAAWFDLSRRGKIFMVGEDRARLLHAMTTNHIQQLTPGEGCYAFFLNAQGRILADVNVLCLEDRLLLDTEPEVGKFIYRHLDKYIIADDVTLEDASDRLSALAVEGPEASSLLDTLEAPRPETPFSSVLWGSCIVARLSFTGAPGFRIFVPASEKQSLTDRLNAAGAPTASEDEARTVRLEHGRPRYGEDIFETTLPQETQQGSALHFNKGCYLGQEIVERIRSRGHVNRLLASLEIEGNQAPGPGTRVLAAGKEVGKITSAAFSPALSALIALAYISAPFVRADAELSVEGQPARVRTPSESP